MEELQKAMTRMQSTLDQMAARYGDSLTKETVTPAELGVLCTAARLGTLFLFRDYVSIPDELKEAMQLDIECTCEILRAIVTDADGIYHLAKSATALLTQERFSQYVISRKMFGL